MNRHSSQTTACGLAELSRPPSRHDNPFATCWTRPGAIAFQFDDGQSTGELVAKLAAQGWWGAIVGPHGSGKTTLLETLMPILRGAGHHVRAISLRNGQRRLPCCFFRMERALVIIDGYEQLGWLERARLKHRCRRVNHELLVTTHSPTSIPTLIRLAPEERLVRQLVADLTAHVSTPITPADVAASHARFGSNVREILFDLYDRHERRRRAERTFIRAGT
jgi:energy-coupling factor transporter ATP-binding protein EcfA2